MTSIRYSGLSPIAKLPEQVARLVFMRTTYFRLFR